MDAWPLLLLLSSLIAFLELEDQLTRMSQPQEAPARFIIPPEESDLGGGQTKAPAIVLSGHKPPPSAILESESIETGGSSGSPLQRARKLKHCFGE